MQRQFYGDSVREIVPSRIIDKHEKIGFNVPILDYLDLNNKSIKNQLLSDSPVFDLINKEEINNIIQMSNFPNSKSKLLFNFINVKFFFRNFYNEMV